MINTGGKAMKKIPQYTVYPNTGELALDPEYQAERFQLRTEATDDPEMAEARKRRRAICSHDEIFPLGLCVRCGKFTASKEKI